ncbi:MAG: ABC transporter permease [Acidimicrobiales bacterium]
MTATLPTTIAAAASLAPGPSLGADLRLVAHQVRAEQRSFWRNRSRAAFSIAFPLVFLVVFCAMNGNDRIEALGNITFATWFVPGILAYGLIMATFSNVAISTCIARDSGLLKRLRGTPLPAWAFFVGRIASTLLVASALVVATLALGIVAYGVTLRTSTLPALLVTLLVGSACFTALGLAITGFIPNADAAPAIVNLIVLPLTFISGIWVVMADAPTWLQHVAEAFPVRALAHGLQHAFDPATAGPGFDGKDLAILAAWTVVGVVVALRRFRWAPAR